MLMVDADNVFNRINRKVALHNVKQLCPPLHTYLQNHYQTPANLVISNPSTADLDDLVSDEGCTQGDVSATFFYALGIKPLIDHLHETCCDPENCQQS